MVNHWSNKRFRILLFIIAVAGASQGLLIPLLTILLEEQGVSSTVNGLSTATLYIGILVMAPIGPKFVREFGYKRSVIIGLLITTAAVILFPFVFGVWIWSILRFFVGVGDSLLHYTIQSWVTLTAPEEERGNRISQYGLAYALGFGIGPAGVNLLNIGESVPYLLLALVLLVTLYLCRKISDQAVVLLQEEHTGYAGAVRVVDVYKIGLVALCPSVLYGILELVFAGNFPIYALREGISKGSISILISAFIWGSLITQVPLGILGDRIGRKNLLIGVCTLGALGMALVPFLMPHVVLLFITFLLIGGLVGSVFTLGLSYMTDILPTRYLLTANSISSVHFSLGSIIGPYLGGLFIQHFGGSFLFFFISFTLISFVLLAIFYRASKDVTPEMYSQKKAI